MINLTWPVRPDLIWWSYERIIGAYVHSYDDRMKRFGTPSSFSEWLLCSSTRWSALFWRPPPHPYPHVHIPSASHNWRPGVANCSTTIWWSILKCARLSKIFTKRLWLKYRKLRSTTQRSQRTMNIWNIYTFTPIGRKSWKRWTNYGARWKYLHVRGQRRNAEDTGERRNTTAILQTPAIWERTQVRNFPQNQKKVIFLSNSTSTLCAAR